MKSSSLSKSILIPLSSIYELACIYLGLTLSYELEYSLCDIFLPRLYLYFIVFHMTYMLRCRFGSEVMVRCTFGFAHVLARQSIGLESWGDMGRDLVCGRGARIHGNLRI
jgi:hypothetical protein